MTAPYQLPFTHHEAMVLLRAIASHNSAEDTSRLDVQTGTWLAERIIRLIDPDLTVAQGAALAIKEGAR